MPLGSSEGQPWKEGPWGGGSTPGDQCRQKVEVKREVRDPSWVLLKSYMQAPVRVVREGRTEV